jgi:hypothetical protein
VTGPTISVVVAGAGSASGLEACLQSLAAQIPPHGVDVVVVAAAGDGSAQLVARLFPDFRVVAVAAPALVPERWAAGIRATAGDVVALTTEHCVPAKDWLSAIAAAHASPVAAVGGAIEPDDEGRRLDWAIYFCRYSRYMLPLRAGPVADLAADNASYRRRELDRVQDAWRDGFWESSVHEELRGQGRALVLDPAIVVHHQRSFSLGGFLRQRLIHGQHYARRRIRGAPGRRALYLAASPVIPLVLAARIARVVLGKGRHRLALLRAAPLLLLFLLAWTLGEALGYLRGPAR